MIPQLIEAMQAFTQMNRGQPLPLSHAAASSYPAENKDENHIDGRELEEVIKGMRRLFAKARAKGNVQDIEANVIKSHARQAVLKLLLSSKDREIALSTLGTAWDHERLADKFPFASQIRDKQEQIVKALNAGWPVSVKALLAEQLQALGTLLTTAINYRMNNMAFAAFDHAWKAEGCSSLEECMYIIQDFLGTPPLSVEEKNVARAVISGERGPGDRAVFASVDSHLRSLPTLTSHAAPKDVACWVGHACLVSERINAIRTTDPLAQQVWRVIGERMKALLPDHYKQLVNHLNIRDGPYPVLQAVYQSFGTGGWRSAIEMLEMDLETMPRRPFLAMMEFAKYCTIFRDLCTLTSLDTWKPSPPDVGAIRTLLTHKGLKQHEERLKQIIVVVDTDYEAFVTRMTSCDVLRDEPLHELHSISKNGIGPVEAGPAKTINFGDETCTAISCINQATHTRSRCPQNRRRRSREQTPERARAGSRRNFRSRSPQRYNQGDSPSHMGGRGRRGWDMDQDQHRRRSRSRSRNPGTWDRNEWDSDRQSDRRSQYWHSRNGKGGKGGKGGRR
jgi:hypothetical protein